MRNGKSVQLYIIVSNNEVRSRVGVKNVLIPLFIMVMSLGGISDQSSGEKSIATFKFRLFLFTVSCQSDISLVIMKNAILCVYLIHG